MKLWVSYIASVAGILIIAIACATVPITGRTQLNMISERQLTTAADNQFSLFMNMVHKDNRELSGAESPHAQAIVDSVNRVSRKIIEASGLHQYNWRVVVVKANQKNAFVMPNGKIVVFTGILQVAKTDAGLAAVLGHEVGHVAARHQAERVSHFLLVQMGLTAVDAALAANNSRYRGGIGAALGLGAQFGVILPFSRLHESEADHIGLFYMAKAGYNPTEAVGLWGRMEEAEEKGPWEFASTHPSPATRRERLTKLLPEATLYFNNPTRPFPKNIEIEADHKQFPGR